MATLERPRLRPCLVRTPEEKTSPFIFIWDERGITAPRCRVTPREFAWLQWFTGEWTLPEIQAQAGRKEKGKRLTGEELADLVNRMDAALLLEGPAYRSFLANPIREPSCIPCYGGDPDRLREELSSWFTGPRGPGMPRQQRPDGRLRAALIPHIDYARGGFTYAWGFKEVVERTNAGLFVIIGTSHYGTERFTLTRKDFKTPLGIARTDQGYIDRLVAHYGDGLFEDEGAHLPEHSIELEVVFLQYLLENSRPFRIVPLLVGSFQDCVAKGIRPRQQPDITRMIEALRRVETETPEPICYLISGDLAHIGPKFQDPGPLEDAVLERSREEDRLLCQAAADVDMDRFFDRIAAEQDSRRICGLPPAYTLLDAVRPGRGRLLHYDQYVHPRRLESVSFASVAFYR